MVADPMARRGSRRWLVPVAVLTVGLLGLLEPAASANWSVTVAANSGGEAASIAASSPTGVAAACVSSTGYTIKVSWTAPSTRVTKYTVYQATSTTSTPGTYTSTGTATTTSWTSGTLATGKNYWYEVVASYGTVWTSGYSTTTGESTISSTNPECKQP
jgi:hypothetical protein